MCAGVGGCDQGSPDPAMQRCGCRVCEGVWLWEHSIVFSFWKLSAMQGKTGCWVGGHFTPVVAPGLIVLSSWGSQMLSLHSLNNPSRQFTALLKEVSIESEEAFAHLAKGQDFINRTAFADAVDAVFHAQVSDDMGMMDGGGGRGAWGVGRGAWGVGRGAWGVGRGAWAVGGELRLKACVHSAAPAREGLCCPLTPRLFVAPRVLCAGRLCGLQAPSVAR